MEIETDKQQEVAVIEALDTAEWMGRDLKVNKARPRENRNSGGRGRFGGIFFFQYRLARQYFYNISR